MRLRVADSGAGITPEVLPHIFDPFFTTKVGGGGTGLGLAIVHRIVSQAGGRIVVESEPGRGTRFDIFLPRVEGAAHHPERSLIAAAQGRGEVLLLIEDDAAVRRVTARILEQAGYRVTVASGGAEALALTGDLPAPPDLVVADVMMADINGVAAVAELRRRHGPLTALFISGHPLDVLGRHGLDPDEIQLLAKPFSADVLLSRVRQLLDRGAGAPG